MQTAKSNKELLHARYVYLDWNVIKYMKDSRTDKGQLDIDFKNLVFMSQNIFMIVQKNIELKLIELILK